MNFLQYKIIGAPKKFKNQPRPLVRPSSVNFSQNFFNLSRETVPLKLIVFLLTTLPAIISTNDFVESNNLNSVSDSDLDPDSFRYVDPGNVNPVFKCNILSFNWIIKILRLDPEYGFTRKHGSRFNEYGSETQV
jgi:hypothetical protein